MLLLGKRVQIESQSMKNAETLYMNFLTIDNAIVKNRTKLVLRHFITWVGHF